MSLNNKTSEPLRFALPKNTRLRDDVFPYLKEALKLEAGDYGTYKSPVLPNTTIFEAKIPDIVNFLQQRIVDIGIIGGDTFEEEIRIPQSCSAQQTRQSGFYNPRMFSNEEANECLAEAMEMLPDGAFSLRLPGKLPEMRFLLRKEDIGGSLPQGQVVTPYPNIFEEKRIRLERALPGLPKKLAAFPVNGNTEAFLRNREAFPSLVAAMEIVRSGKTAEKFGLVPIGILNLPVAAPCVVTAQSMRAPSFPQNCFDVMVLVREKMGALVDIAFGLSREEQMLGRGSLLKR